MWVLRGRKGGHEGRPYDCGPPALLNFGSKRSRLHHLVPGLREVIHELLLPIYGRVELRDGAQLGVGSKDQIDRRAVHLTAPVFRSRPS